MAVQDFLQHRFKTGVQVESVSTDRLSIGEIPHWRLSTPGRSIRYALIEFPENDS
jgi:hypothetical protein